MITAIILRHPHKSEDQGKKLRKICIYYPQLSNLSPIAPIIRSKIKIVDRTLKITPLDASQREDSKSGLKNKFAPRLPPHFGV